jgi:hypothetical protein
MKGVIMGRRLHHAPAPFNCLTERELDALASVAGGFSLRQIGINNRYAQPIPAAHELVNRAARKLNVLPIQQTLKDVGLPICYACFEPMHLDGTGYGAVLVHSATGSFTCPGDE